MDEKTWDYLLKSGGFAAGLGFSGLAAWRLGLFKWFGSIVSTKQSSEVIAQKLGEASVKIVERQVIEIEHLNTKIKDLEKETETELKEKKKEIKELETQYDIIVAQFREAKRNLSFNEAELFKENQKLQQKIMELEIELESVRTELNILKKRIVKAETQANKDIPFSD
jgi:hypothetical protein